MIFPFVFTLGSLREVTQIRDGVAVRAKVVPSAHGMKSLRVDIASAA